MNSEESKTLAAGLCSHLMLTRRALPLFTLGFVLISACTDDAKDPSSPMASSSGPTDISCKGKPDVNKSASPFTMASTNTQTRMGVEVGKVTLLDFWATWCEPCKKSFPKYQDLYTKYHASGLEVVAVSVDDEKTDVPTFVRTYGAKFPVGWDDGQKIANCYHPLSMPSAYIIDKTGTIRYMHSGYRDGEEKDIEKEIKELL